MIAAVHDNYESHLASSGKLKLRAKRLLAEGTSEAVFEACVLLHEAARVQRLAIDALPLAPAATQLASAADECWCYVEGRDPARAAEAWEDVLRAREKVDDRTADAMLSRLAPRYEASRRDFARALKASRMLLAIREAGQVDGLGPGDLTRAYKEVAHLLERFPGAAGLWWLQYHLAETAEDGRAAWDAITRARQLSRTNSTYRAMSWLVAAWALPAADADAYLASARSSLDDAGGEECLMYALAEITLARKVAPPEAVRRWERARKAVDMGRTRAETEETLRNLKATQLLVQELLAGREPTMDVLYVAGLEKVAATAKPNANVVDLFTARLRRTAPERVYRVAS